jgi:ribosomal protein L35AE/L33A
MGRIYRRGILKQIDCSKVQQVMCIVKPDTDYTSNQDLVVGGVYLSNRIVYNTESFGQVITGDVWSV